MGTQGLEFLGTLKGGQKVFDRPNSHLHAGVRELLAEALARVETTAAFHKEAVDFGRIVGETTCVATSGDDEVVYAQRPKRAGLTRFVKNRQAEPCSSVVVILKRIEEWDYLLITTFIGNLSESEPWDRNATEKSVEFWNTHALIWGSEEVIPGTETSICPW